MLDLSRHPFVLQITVHLVLFHGLFIFLEVFYDSHCESYPIVSTCGSIYIQIHPRPQELGYYAHV